MYLLNAISGMCFGCEMSCEVSLHCHVSNIDYHKIHAVNTDIYYHKIHAVNTDIYYHKIRAVNIADSVAPTVHLWC